MIERLPDQSLEKGLKIEGVLDFLPWVVKSLIKEIDGLELPLNPVQREYLLVCVLWINKPDPQAIARLLGKPVEEIKEQLKQVFENEELDEVILGLLDPKEPILWWGGSRKPLDSEFKEEVRRLKCEEGLSNKKIAEMWGVQPSRVGHAVTVLRREGRIK